MIWKRTANDTARWISRRPLQAGVAALLLLAAIPLVARDLHVGIDPGVPTIALAIKLAEPGDTIHLEANKVYREYAGFYDKKGEPGRPITLDGHGATLEGSDPIDSSLWRESSPGLFVAEELLPNLSDAVIGRWFFLFDGRVQRMGRTSKGKSEPFKEPADLQPGEWTFVKDPSREKVSSKRIYGAFYLKLAPGIPLADARIALPVRSAGVQLSGDNRHLVIRNLTATHPYNDGFNIHGDCRDVVFEKIRAIECGDDGISAHESAQYRVDGLVSIGNSTGICDTGTAQTSYTNVFIADCVGFDLYFLDEGRYSLSHAVVLSSAQNPLTVTGRAVGECHLTLENVMIRRLAGRGEGKIAARAYLEGTGCRIDGLEINVTGRATWKNSLINGQPSELGALGANLSLLQSLIPENYPDINTNPIP